MESRNPLQEKSLKIFFCLVNDVMSFTGLKDMLSLTHPTKKKMGVSLMIPNLTCFAHFVAEQWSVHPGYFGIKY